MSKNRTGLYLGLAVAGAGGYYLYRAGGNVEGAKKEIKCASFLFYSFLELCCLDMQSGRGEKERES